MTHVALCACNCGCRTVLTNGNRMHQQVDDTNVYLCLCVECYTGNHHPRETPK